jgi:hypothetical protein
MNRSLVTSFALAVTASFTLSLADQIVMFGAQPKSGTFQGVDGGRMLIVNEAGKFRKEQPSRITRIVLAKPLKIQYLAADSKQEEDGLLKGYDKQKFQITKDGKDLEIAAAKIKSMDIVGDATGGGGAGNRYPVPDIDLTFAEGPDATPAQKSAAARFKAAKKAYDDFVAESSDLVSKMDKATGAKRESILNELRMRKNQEQPLKSELMDACSALTELHPEAPQKEPVAPTKKAK